VITALAAATLTYALALLVVGRFLAWHDLLPRPRADRRRLDGRRAQDVSFQAPSGITLRGWFLRGGPGADGRALVVVHGWHRHRASKLDHLELLVDAGYHVLAYDQRSHGESDTALLTYGPGEADDLLAAVAWLAGRPEVDAGRIGALGFSLGGGGVIHAAAREGRPCPFRAVVLEGVFAESSDVGRFLLQRRLGRVAGYLVGVLVFNVGTWLWSLGRFRHARPVDHAPHVGCPLMIIRGGNDHMVPEDSAERLIAAAGTRCTVWRTPDGGHTTALETHPEAYRERVLAFLDQRLGCGR